MKVRVTFEINDEQRMAIGFGSGALRPATREEIEKFVTEAVAAPLTAATIDLVNLVDAVKKRLDKS